FCMCFFFQAEDGIRDPLVTGVQTCALPILHRLAEIPGIVRLRYSTSHPRDVDDTLVEAHRDLPALMPFVHLPVQSGSDRILAAMNRKHTADDYRRVIDRFRAARQDIAFSSDFIVGFPGEP